MNYLKYNIEIFKAWYLYIFLKKPISKKAIDYLKLHYKASKIEQKIIKRIQKLNNHE